MARSLDPTLLAAMNSGIFTPYFKVELMDLDRTTVLWSTTDVKEFEIDSLSARVSFHDPTYVQGWYTFRIQRGCWIAGAANVITTSSYFPRIDRHYKRIRTLEGHIFPNESYSLAANRHYDVVIEDVCNHFHFHTVTYEDPAAAWLDYLFMPYSTILAMKDAKTFFTLLRQKYLIFATDLGGDALYFYQAKATTPAEAAYIHTTAKEIHAPGEGALRWKSFVSRDETDTIHTSGNAWDPVHHLGYLEASDSHPDRTWFIDTQDWIIKGITPNLKYLDFDPMAFIYDVIDANIYPIKLRESYNTRQSPTWQWWGTFLDIFGNTEGGEITDDVYTASPFMPLNTSTFNRNLTVNEVNIQSAIERIDNVAAGLYLSNVFTSISPITTPAESWVGPSALNGIYFKNGCVGFGIIDPTSKVHIYANAGASNTVLSVAGATTNNVGIFFNTHVQGTGTNVGMDTVIGCTPGADNQVVYATRSAVYAFGARPISLLSGYMITTLTYAGSTCAVNGMVGVFIEGYANGGAVGTYRAIQIAAVAPGTSNWAIYSEMVGSSYLAGALAIKNTNPLGNFSMGYGSAEAAYITWSTPDVSSYHFYYNSGDVNKRSLDITSLGGQDGSNGGGIIRLITNPGTSNTAVERLRVERDGYIGINTGATSHPSKRLDILDTSVAQLRLTYSHDTMYTDFQVNNAGDLTITPVGHIHVTSNVDSTVGFSINGVPVSSSSDTYWLEDTGDIYFSAGKVGIGVIPLYDLHLTGDFAITGVLLITDTGITLNVDELGTVDFVLYSDSYISIFVDSSANSISFMNNAAGKIGFFGAAAVVQPVAATDLGVVLSDLGLRPAGTAYPITTSGVVHFGDATNYTGISAAGNLTQAGTARIAWTKIAANNIAILGTHGTLTGAVATLQTAHDASYLQVHEAAHTPGFDFQVEMISVTAFNWVRILGSYVGQSTHSVAIELYNFVSAAYDTFDIMRPSVWSTTANEQMWECHDFFVANCTAYIGTGADSGDVRIRFTHPAAGNSSDHLYLDIVALYQ